MGHKKRDKHFIDAGGRGITAPHGAHYPDPEHPLFVGFYSTEKDKTPEQQMREIESEIAEEHNIPYAEEPTARRLREAYERAKERDGLTLAKWAEYATNGRSSKHTVASEWLKSPSTMTRSEVMRTCELFGCSLEYLQGKEWDSGYLAKTYERLNTKQRVLICDMMSQLSRANFMEQGALMLTKKLKDESGNS